MSFSAPDRASRSRSRCWPPLPLAAQSVLRIGLNDDPDALDPTISRAYVGRLVFAALCDKLFDVTPDLKIVPQLAAQSRVGGRPANRSSSSCARA